jgi:hypothetical protein
MRKMLLALSVLALLTTAVSTATAQNQIALGDSASNSLTFTSTGAGGWTLSLTPNPLNCSGKNDCSATGEAGWSAISGTYSINQNGVTITGTPVSGQTGYWTITQSGAMLFSIGSELTGNLYLLNLAQTGKTGAFNYDLAANLTITGGSLASLVGNGAECQLDIEFDSSTALGSLKSGQTLGARISSGEIDATPEPGSMALVGIGLLLGGIVLRRRPGR